LHRSNKRLFLKLRSLTVKRKTE